ncbi:hypothetical protein OAA19_01275 [Rubripirellula sp.]|nr:hypothetical protein [Rubripirellula sp.]MDB4338718.1 hypothetical protein [Rubripirellula sp.]
MSVGLYCWRFDVDYYIELSVKPQSAGERKSREVYARKAMWAFSRYRFRPGQRGMALGQS